MSTEFHDITIGPRSLQDSLRKLWDGFCYPSRDTVPDEDLRERGTRTGLSSKDASLVSTAGINESQMSDKAAATTPTTDPKSQIHTKRTDIVVTNQGRRKRVIRGLEVAFVALIAVASTLFTLHRLGYVADLQFTKSNYNSNSRFGRRSKPLIKIQKNDKGNFLTRKRPR